MEPKREEFFVWCYEVRLSRLSLKIFEPLVCRYKNKDENLRSLPLLTSSCPGWICYAEKTHGELILPHLSAVKSPQQVTATLVKETAAKLLDKSPDKCYHVAIMPCYDKKLEASRQDFYNSEYSVRDVDLVLAANEVQTMLEDAKINLKDLLNSEKTIKTYG